MTDRQPPADREVPEGYKLVAVPEGNDWRVSSGALCSFWSGSTRIKCMAPAVAVLRRGSRRPTRWHYCPEHMYGRWVEDGEVWHWRPWPLDPCPAPGCLLNAGHDHLHDIRAAGDPVYWNGLPQSEDQLGEVPF